MTKEEIIRIIRGREAVASYKTFNKALEEVEKALDKAEKAEQVINDARTAGMCEAWGAAIWFLNVMKANYAAELLKAENINTLVNDYREAQKESKIVEMLVHRLAKMYGHESVFNAIDKMREEKNP